MSSRPAWIAYGKILVYEKTNQMLKMHSKTKNSTPKRKKTFHKTKNLFLVVNYLNLIAISLALKLFEFRCVWLI